MTQGSWQTSGPVMLLILLWQASWFSSISLPVPMKLSTGFSSLSLAVILGPDMRCKLTLLDKDHATDPSKTFATYKSWSPNESRYASPTSQKFFHSFQGDPTDLSSAFSSSWRALCTCVCVCVLLLLCAYLQPILFNMTLKFHPYCPYCNFNHISMMWKVMTVQNVKFQNFASTTSLFVARGCTIGECLWVMITIFRPHLEFPHKFQGYDLP